MIANSNTRQTLAFIIFLGCFLRLLYAFLVPNEFPVWADGQHYLSIARNLANDFQYQNSWYPPEDHPRFGDVGLTSYREPVYPFFLAFLLKLFGDSPRSIFVIQALLSTLTIPLCFGVGALLWSNRPALLAAFLESVNPYHIYFTASIATETLTCVILLGVVFFTLRIFRSINTDNTISKSQIGLLALFLSTGILTRAVFVPIFLITIVFIGGSLYYKSKALKSACKVVGSLTLIVILCACPWFIRNYLVWQTIVYQTTAGHNLVLGYNGFATGGYGHKRFLELDRALIPQGYDEVERDRIYKEEAFNWIRANPGKALFLFLKKQLLFWNPVPETTKGYQKGIGIMWGVVFLGLTFIGFGFARGQTLALKYVFSVITVYVIVHTVLVAITRYRIPLEGLLSVFAGYGLFWSLTILRFRFNQPLLGWIKCKEKKLGKFI